METLRMIVGTILTPISSVSEYISTASTSYKKEKQVLYFTAVQNTLPTGVQQEESQIRERAKTISELWNQD